MKERSAAAAWSHCLLLSLHCFCFLYWISSYLSVHFIFSVFPLSVLPDSFTLFRLSPCEFLASLPSLWKPVFLFLFFYIPVLKPSYVSISWGWAGEGRMRGWWRGVCRVLSLYIYEYLLTLQSEGFPHLCHTGITILLSAGFNKFVKENLYCTPFYFKYIPQGLTLAGYSVSALSYTAPLLLVPYISGRVCTAETARSPRKLSWQLLFAS